MGEDVWAGGVGRQLNSEAANGLADSTGPLSIHEVMSMIKHRYPLLLIDRIVDCVPGRSIHGLKNVSRGETIAATKDGLPRLVLVEALAQVSVILTFKTLRLQPTGNELMFFAGIDDGHFEGSVRPGDVVSLYSEIVRLRKTMGWFRAAACVDGRTVARMSMLAAIQLG